MKILFNHNNKGQEEIKALLGFLDADLNYDNLESDIDLNTPRLIRIIGDPMFNKIYNYYTADPAPNAEDADNKKLAEMLPKAQLYTLLLGYLDYAQNSDLIHGNTGRKAIFAEDEKTPFPWQIDRDNAGLSKRGFKAIDRLIMLLDKSGFAEWTDSDQYKKAAALFLYNTEELQEVYPINHSGLLYHNLVPFLTDIEKSNLISLLGSAKYQDLKSKIRAEDNSENDDILIHYCKKISGFRAMSKAAQLLPEEMCDFSVNYKMSDKDREDARERRAQKFMEEALEYEKKLETEISKLEEIDNETNPLHGIQPGRKFVNL